MTFVTIRGYHFQQRCINSNGERIHFINVASLPDADRGDPRAMAEVEESSCGGNGAAARWARRQAAIIHRWDRDGCKQFDESRFTPAPRECICYCRRHCCWSRLHFRKGKDHRRFYAVDCRLLTCSTFVYALFVTVRRTPHRTLLLLLQVEVVTGVEKRKDNAVFSRGWCILIMVVTTFLAGR